MKQPTLKVKIINKSKHELPKYKTPGSAGADLRANIDEPVRLQPGERALVPTGIHIELLSATKDKFEVVQVTQSNSVS